MKTILLTGLLLTTSLFASGDRGGNGGDAVVCPHSAMLLDTYEMSSRGFTLSLPGESTVEKVSVAVERLLKVDPYLGTKLQTYSKEIIDGLNGLNKLVRITTDNLVDIPDSLELTLPRGCTLEQMVIQQKPIYSTDPRYIISGRYFGLMDNTNKALTILHEAWYRISLDKEAKDSRFARFMNGVFASAEYANISKIEFLDMLREVTVNSGSFPVGTVFPIGLSVLGDAIGLNANLQRDGKGGLLFESQENIYSYVYTGVPKTAKFFRDLGLDVIFLDVHKLHISAQGEVSLPRVCVRARPFSKDSPASGIRRGSSAIEEVQGVCFSLTSEGEIKGMYSFPNVKSITSDGKMTKPKGSQYIKFHLTKEELVIDEILKNDCFKPLYDQRTLRWIYWSQCE